MMSIGPLNVLKNHDWKLTSVPPAGLIASALCMPAIILTVVVVVYSLASPIMITEKGLDFGFWGPRSKLGTPTRCVLEIVDDAAGILRLTIYYRPILNSKEQRMHTAFTRDAANASAFRQAFEQRFAPSQ